MSEPVLQVDGLVRHFNDVHAVDDVTFSVARGQVLGFIGPNGAGKTTTMRILATLDVPQRGDARIAGYSVVEQPDKVRRVMGFMPDYAGVYTNTTVFEYLDFFARAGGLHGDARRRAVDTIVEFMVLGDLRERQVEGLSKGMKQRVALGRALIHGPQLLILDEPAANLDPRARIEFRTLIRELAADGKTILLSSHILTELSEMCDTVTVIEKGRILASGTVREIVDGLRQRRMLSVRLAAPDPRLERFLLEQPGVVGVHDAGAADAESGVSRTLRFELDGDDQAQVQLVGRLVAAGFPILEFSAHGAGLEDVFIEITNGRVQ
jgi:ABC-2 type transport system ATP-binding protein